jgi:DNA-binding transcriptional MerR regulator/quercetin dioxygenase-like cupin family protein
MNKIQMHNDEITFSINEVAKILGVVPTTVRNWEKSGLFTAKRKDNNYRIYTFDDIELLKRIKKYSIDDSLPLKSIKSMISSDQSSPYRVLSDMKPVDARFSKKLLSNRWKEAREKNQITLEEVGGAIGISASYLSKIENGQANVSYEILEKLALYYGESILFFFDRDVTEEKVVRNNTGEIVSIGLPGVQMESLVDVNEHMLYPMIFKIKPGCGSSETHSHHGEEFIHVLEGQLDVTLNYEENFRLETGDSMYFMSSEDHSWKNNSKKTTRLLWVHSPISNRE